MTLCFAHGTRSLIFKFVRKYILKACLYHIERAEMSFVMIRPNVVLEGEISMSLLTAFHYFINILLRDLKLL